MSVCCIRISVIARYKVLDSCLKRYVFDLSKYVGPTDEIS